jgi:hypothetical protein
MSDTRMAQVEAYDDGPHRLRQRLKRLKALQATVDRLQRHLETASKKLTADRLEYHLQYAKWDSKIDEIVKKKARS